MAKNIETTIYSDLETAIRKKKEVIDEFKKQYNWDHSQKQYAETLGMIAALEDALTNNK